MHAFFTSLASNLSGKRAEQLSAAYLKKRGLTLIERNYRCRFGEVDLIMQHGNTLVFTEVRFRGNAFYGSAVETVISAKRKRIIAAAKHYLSGKQTTFCRFDVVVLDALDEARIEWIQDAFSE